MLSSVDGLCYFNCSALACEDTIPFLVRCCRHWCRASVNDIAFSLLKDTGSRHMMQGIHAIASKGFDSCRKCAHCFYTIFMLTAGRFKNYFQRNIQKS